MARPKPKKRQPTRQTSTASKNQQTLWIIMGVAALAVILLIAIGLLSRQSSQPSTASVIGEVSARGKTLGDPNAPVEVWDFSDFHCPHCRRFAQETVPQLVETYVKTGKVRLVYKHFIVIRSWDAANASECAAEQGKFWEYHDYLFQRQETDAPFTKDKLKQYARDLGLDTAKFDQCVDTGKYMNVVQKEMDEGRRLGVRGTPSIFVNGKFIPRGALWPDLQQAIEQALQEAGSG